MAPTNNFMVEEREERREELQVLLSNVGDGSHLALFSALLSQ